MTRPMLRLITDDNANAWMEQGACLGVDPDLFFPEKGQSYAPAKAVCARCDVKDECLEYAIVNVERFGCWGGTSERERRWMRKAHNAKKLGEIAR